MGRHGGHIGVGTGVGAMPGGIVGRLPPHSHSSHSVPVPLSLSPSLSLPLSLPLSFLSFATFPSLAVQGTLWARCQMEVYSNAWGGVSSRRRHSPRHLYSLSRQWREVPDLLSCVQCFGIYTTVLASWYTKQILKVLALVVYQTLMVREAGRCGGKSWLSYDLYFR